MRSPASGSRLVGNLRSPMSKSQSLSKHSPAFSQTGLFLQEEGKNDSVGIGRIRNSNNGDDNDGSNDTCNRNSNNNNSSSSSDSLNAAVANEEIEEPGLEFEFIGIAIEDLYQWLSQAAKVLRALRRPRILGGILDLDDTALEATLRVAGANFEGYYHERFARPRSHTRNLCSRTRTLPDSKRVPESHSASSSESMTLAEHDVSVLARIVFESLSAANIYDWFDKFKEDCEPWHFSAKNGVNTSDSNKRSNSNSFDFTNCRFVRALSDLESTGLIKVKSGGTEVQRIAYLWMGNFAELVARSIKCDVLWKRHAQHNSALWSGNQPARFSGSEDSKEPLQKRNSEREQMVFYEVKLYCVYFCLLFVIFYI